MLLIAYLYFMEGQNTYRQAENWVNDLLAKGRYSFSIEQFKDAFKSKSAIANKFALARLVEKRLLASIHRGYYVILTPQYKKKGVLPPVLFLDAFMRQLERPYYLALLNAAAYYGAAHQQPQEFFVVTSMPALRPLQHEALKINFISKVSVPEQLIQHVKTEVGYLNVSSPVLTATDLVSFEKRIGGLSRATTILSELVEQITVDDFSDALTAHVPVAVLQRLGYILDRILAESELADALHQAIEKNNNILYRVPLKTSVSHTGFETDEKWKVVINTVVETDI